MPSDVTVLRADDPRCERLADDGWTVTARSWAAHVELTPRHTQGWRDAMARLASTDTCRELTADDVPAVLALDAATAGDYPGSVATAHEALTPHTATPTVRRPAFGVLDDKGDLVAITFVDIEADPTWAEVDFTVVAPHRRRQGLATALKAASLLGLMERGVTDVRTGGSDENRGIIAANEALGFRVDERWVTMVAPAKGPDA